jgi:hypothetical protein
MAVECTPKGVDSRVWIAHLARLDPHKQKEVGHHGHNFHIADHAHVSNVPRAAGCATIKASRHNALATSMQHPHSNHSAKVIRSFHNRVKGALIRQSSVLCTSLGVPIRLLKFGESLTPKTSDLMRTRNQRLFVRHRDSETYLITFK